MSNPTFDRIHFAMFVAMVAVFVWASIDYNRFIKFWMLRPAPYSWRVIVIFRVFFLACVVGALWQVVETALYSPKPAIFYLTALPLAVGCFIMYVLMINLVERTHSKWRAK